MIDKDNSFLFLGDVVPFKPFKFHNSYKTVINLECPITSEGIPAKNKINLRVEKNHLHDIFGPNLSYVSLGNNHILDFGEQGLESTLKALKELNVQWFGLNNESSPGPIPLIVWVNEMKVALFSVVCESTSPIIKLNNNMHLSTLEPESIIGSIGEIRDSVQRIILYLHWGVEESSYPSEENIVLARKLIDAGVDIIIGSHAHAPQPVEKYKEGIIAYSLGNFIMPELKDIPAYFDDNNSSSAYYKNLLLWNRISWGLIVDLKTKEYKIKKYISMFGRIIRLPFTPFDRYLKLNYDEFKERYNLKVSQHRQKRALLRRIRYFVSKPYVPERIKKIF